ncbi:endo alpha-1,4 polygalactosaminidase [Calditerrivibrio sp.]|uniref:endo alpha-1,4 polygalactosaminidase n=1 Tax=Calditerrivibrio sp. TaxID=2792612 RepID=UPI003D11E9FA
MNWNMKPIVLLISIILLGTVELKAKNFELNGCGIAFYYKKEPSKEMVKFYDYIVVDPDNIKQVNKKFIAYLSVGEVENYRKYYNKIDKKWILGVNKNWNTEIVDVRNENYQNFLLDIIDNISKEGFSGIFLDTLDSYQFLKTKNNIDFEKSLSSFIKKIRKKYPNLLIIANRGFEFIDENFKGVIDAVVAEGLFTDYDFTNKKYTKQTKEGTEWLKNRLNQIKSYGIEVIVIDYAEKNNRESKRVIAKKILESGFIPFVSDINLESFGISKCEYYPRKIITIYNDEASKDYSKVSATRLLPVPLEYLGYFIEHFNPDKTTLPTDLDQYAGVVVWPETDLFKYESNFYNWIEKVLDYGLPVLFINFFGFNLTDDRIKKIGLKISENKDDPQSVLKIVDKSEDVNFEANINPFYTQYLYETDGEPLLVLENSKKQKHMPIAISRWGGYTLSESTIVSIPDELWIVNPFSLLHKGLRLPVIPAPDVTTENGRRIFFSHLDGDGFKEIAVYDKKRYASEIIRDEIFKKYDLPFTVSIIEAEIAPYGIYPKESPKLEEIARSIFKLDNVEIATHSFSHPFKWRDIEIKENTQAYNLQIKDYSFDLKREIIGSTKYINKNLAPDNKKTKVFLWTGDCNPSEEAVKLTYENGLLNLNGGGSTMTDMEPYLGKNYPIGIKKGELYQIYAPNQNENVYTNLWRSGFYKYKNVIQTFKLTDAPRRIKPMNVYYHFYSGSKISSFKSLKEVYDYAVSQKITAMFASDYILRALDFYETVLGKDLTDDSWIIKTNGNLRTLKIPANFNLYPEINKDILGFNMHNDMLYIHLTDQDKFRLKLNNYTPDKPYIKETNGVVVRKKEYNKLTKIFIKGYQPIEVILKKMNRCKIESDKKFIKTITDKDEVSFKFIDKEVEFVINCS